MKLCLIGPIPPFRGGIAKYCYSLAKELEQRHDLLLLSYARQYPALLYGNKSQTDPDIDRKAIAGEFRRLSFAIDSASPRSWRRTSQEIAAFAPDLVILPWWVVYWAPMYLYLLRALKKRGTRVVVLCINVFEHEDNFVKKWLTRMVLRRAGTMIVHSGEERQEILGFAPTATVKEHLLPLFCYPGTAAAHSGASLKLLFFGFVRPYKGLDVLLRALALLKHLPVSLKIAGEFWKDKELYLKLIDELGISERVSVQDGYISEQEMGRLFTEADLVVLPYKKSRTSGIIATAYGYGKPVLATEIGGFHEIVSDACTGKLVPPDNPEAFAGGIQWFWDNRGRDFSDNIRRFTERKMSWKSLVDLIEES